MGAPFSRSHLAAVVISSLACLKSRFSMSCTEGTSSQYYQRHSAFVRKSCTSVDQLRLHSIAVKVAGYHPERGTHMGSLLCIHPNFPLVQIQDCHPHVIELAQVLCLAFDLICHAPPAGLGLITHQYDAGLITQASTSMIMVHVWSRHFNATQNTHRQNHSLYIRACCHKYQKVPGQQRNRGPPFL